MVFATYAFNVNGGSAIVNGLLCSVRSAGSRSAEPAPESSDVHAGRLIGILERSVILTFVLLGQWEAMGFVLTGKSVARFARLDKQDFAEQYLVGTFTSFVVAGASGLLLRFLLGIDGG